MRWPEFQIKNIPLTSAKPIHETQSQTHKPRLWKTFACNLSSQYSRQMHGIVSWVQPTSYWWNDDRLGQSNSNLSLVYIPIPKIILKFLAGLWHVPIFRRAHFWNGPNFKIALYCLIKTRVQWDRMAGITSVPIWNYKITMYTFIFMY